MSDETSFLDGGQPEDYSSGGQVAAPPGRHGRRRAPSKNPDRVLTVLRGVGQTLITGGLVILLFVVYEVWVTNIFADIKQTAVHNTLVKQWAQGDNPLVAASLPGAQTSTIPTGTGIANIYIPRLGADYHFTIVQGTSDADLDKGPGHYSDSALPGQIGDFAVAGHRVGKGEPFLNLDQLVPGDAVVIETATDWYIYKVNGNVATGDLATPTAAGVVGREIVNPSDGNVILPVPDHPGVKPSVALITLTTCHPKFTATQRMIVHGALVRTVPRNGNLLPKELVGGTL
jgi:sortase A